MRKLGKLCHVRHTLPLVFDEALSYYECLAKLQEELKETYIVSVGVIPTGTGLAKMEFKFEDGSVIESDEFAIGGGTVFNAGQGIQIEAGTIGLTSEVMAKIGSALGAVQTGENCLVGQTPSGEAFKVELGSGLKLTGHELEAETGSVKAGNGLVLNGDTLGTNVEDTDEIIHSYNGGKLGLHLHSDISQKLDNALVKPVTPTTGVKLVGVDGTTQKMVGIGNGLEVSGNTLRATGSGQRMYVHPMHLSDDENHSLGLFELVITRADVIDGWADAINYVRGFEFGGDDAPAKVASGYVYDNGNLFPVIGLSNANDEGVNLWYIKGNQLAKKTIAYYEGYINDLIEG